MDPDDITAFLTSFSERKDRTIVIVDFSNVDKWEKSLRWRVGIQELGKLVKHFAFGDESKRRFYYGSDFGPRESSPMLSAWSSGIITRAKMNRFKVITKPVKYIHNNNERAGGYEKKCDLDVEMTVDLIRMKDDYDNIVVFSGDGDLVCALRYLYDNFGKVSYVFGARGHVGREVVDAVKEGIIAKLLYTDDFKIRLDADRFRHR